MCCVCLSEIERGWCAEAQLSLLMARVLRWTTVLPSGVCVRRRHVCRSLWLPLVRCYPGSCDRQSHLPTAGRLEQTAVYCAGDKALHLEVMIKDLKSGHQGDHCVFWEHRKHKSNMVLFWCRESWKLSVLKKLVLWCTFFLDVLFQPKFEWVISSESFSVWTIFMQYY